MFPIPIIIAIAVALIGGSALLTININKLLGKKFAILGTRASGKTTLHNFLGSGEISTEYVETTEGKTKDNYFKLKHLKLRINSTTDIGGSEDFINRWEDLIKRADYICYIVKTNLIEKNDMKYVEKAERHINLILEHMKKHHKTEKKLYIIYNFCDLLPEYNENNESFLDTIKKKTIKINQKNTIPFYGSLIDNKQASDLCVKLLAKISSI